MGTPVPITPPDFKDDKYYALKTEVYEYDFEEDTCEIFSHGMSCCRLGSWIKSGSGACPRIDHGYCQLSGVFMEHLLSAVGPFDTLEECNAWRAGE